MRQRALDIGKQIHRQGLIISLPRYMAPGDSIALGEFLASETHLPFVFHVRDMGAFTEACLKRAFPYAIVVNWGADEIRQNAGKFQKPSNH